MKNAIATMLLLLCVTADASAQAPQPIARVRVEPAQHIVVGQPVRLIVEVLVPNYFTGSPQFPELEMKNVIIVSPQETPQNLSEQIAGVAYAGIRQTYFVYPEQAGEFHLPSARIKVRYADTPPHSLESDVPLPTLTFRADIPAAATGLSYFLPTTRLVMEQHWKPSLKDLRSGQTVERTITITTDMLQAMLIPPVPLEVPDGLRVYPEEPIVKDEKTDRGEFIGGQRIQTAKYLIQNPGEYTLPEIELKWWDLNEGRVRTQTLPAVHISAAMDPNYAPELPPTVEPAMTQEVSAARPWKRYRLWIRAAWPGVLASLGFVWLVARRGFQVVRWMRIKIRQNRESEGAYFRRLIASCNRNEASASYQQLVQWLRRARTKSAVEEFLQDCDDPTLTNQVKALGEELYFSGNSKPWDGRALADSLKRHRRASEVRAKKRYRLPPLNPLNVATSLPRRDGGVRSDK